MRQSTKTTFISPGAPVVFYRAALPLSSKTLTFTSGIIRRHRAAIGSSWRKLNSGQQALLVLACLRKGETFAHLAAGFGVGTTTAWRYVTETVELLAARAPGLRTALRDAVRAGYAYVVLDGTLILVGRVAADRPFYSGKHRKHGMNLQVIASPDGGIVWVSGALPGSVHDKKAEWIWGVLAALDAAGLVVLADKGYQAAPMPRSRTGAGANRNHKSRPIRPTRSSGHPASARTLSSKPGTSSASSAAAPGAPASSPRPSTYCKSARHNRDGKGSVAGCRRVCQSGRSGDLGGRGLIAPDGGDRGGDPAWSVLRCPGAW